MDLTQTIIPKSDQLNAEDLLAGPMTVTVESVNPGSAEQPVDFHLVEHPGRAYRPSKTMRRVIVKAWGKESDAYAGRRMTLYRDPEVKFGGQKVGGIKISHLSHINKGFSLALTETRGKRTPHTVEPLIEAPATTSAADAATPQQIARIGALMKPAGLDRDGILRFTAETIGRPVKSSSDLTADEAGAVIDALEPLVDGGGEG